jgi:glucose/arabinose dehydrogenase
MTCLRHALPVLLTLPVACPLAADVPPEFVEETVAAGLDRPVSLAVAPDGRVFIGEQWTGNIRVLKDGKVLPKPFATLQPVWTGHNESGLVGLCVDPDFRKNGHVYAFITQTAEVQRVWRFTAEGDAAKGAPDLFIDKIPTIGQNHDGGGIGFGPDGHFYVAVGESGPMPYVKESQDTSSWRGKILRFTRAGKPAPGNPFGPANAVWAYGLRNPFRFDFQPGTKKMFVSENGPDKDDEINVIVRGGNYGWPALTGQPGTPPFRDALIVIPRPPSITGLCFYRGDKLPYKNQLFYTCHNTGVIRRVKLGGDGEEVLEHDDFVGGLTRPVEVVTGPDGALWYTTMGRDNPDGKIWRVFSK